MQSSVPIPISSAGRRLRILVISWNYPTPAAPQRGLWAERMCNAASQHADISVIVPTPWVPPLVPLSSIARFRQIPQRAIRGSVEIHFPRVPGSIEYFTHGFDARLALPNVLALARRLHDERPFDLIHAHFIFPDGVVASAMGQALHIPVMTSEHAFWTPWLHSQRRVGAQVDSALPGIRLIAPVSQFLLNNVATYLDGRVETAVLPNVVDDSVFFPAPRQRDPHELLYVGLIRRLKRVDVLIRALAEVRRTIPEMHLKILSANAFRSYRQDRGEVSDLITRLGLGSAIQIVNGSDPIAVAEAMRCCSLVVVSSARETFCSVAAESLACGTPLVLTRCGGPEEFVTTADGVMVEVDGPDALANGILEAIRRREAFDPIDMHARIAAKFGQDAWCNQAMALYERVVG